MQAVKLAGLEPAPVLGFFEQLSSIPHGSGNTSRMRDFLAAFAAERGLRYIRDEGGNVIIFKDAAPGYENHPPIILQSHMDMVCAKDADCTHDFQSEGLDLAHDEEFIWARGTSLGADDGLGMAYILAILDDKALSHPALEAVFTDEEEVGMGGAKKLDCSVLKSKRMLNMDTLNEGLFTIGCAGGAKVDCSIPAIYTPCSGTCLQLDLENFRSGHSGANIHKPHANCIKVLADLLAEIRRLTSIRLVRLQGGTSPNAIPKDVHATIILEQDCTDAVIAICQAFRNDIGKTCNEQDAVISVQAVQAETALSQTDTNRIIDLLREVPNGVQSWIPELPDVVQTSLNVGRVRLEEKFLAEYQLRSSVPEEKEALKQTIMEIGERYGIAVRCYGENPAWPYRKESPLCNTMADTWKEMFGCEPRIVVFHVGLECGIFAEKIPDLEAVSTCSSAFGVHTSKERMSIPSAQRFWPFLKQLLSRL